MHKVLIAADNSEFTIANEKYLADSGYDVAIAVDGEGALGKIEKEQFDCIIIDMMLPDMDGLSLCTRIRKKAITPVIFIGGKEKEDEKIRALMGGGDDFIAKPYSLRELGARVYVQIRRSMLNSQSLVMDEKNANIAIGGFIINFSKKEFDLLMLFYKNPNRIFSSREIYNILWEKETVSSNSVAVYVKRLRNKLKVVSDQFGQIKNSYKMGYYFLPAKNKKQEF